MVTHVLLWHMGANVFPDAFKMRHVETYYAQKTTAAACPGSFRPLSPHANRRRPVKQHLRQLKDIKQSKNDQNIGSNGCSTAYGAVESLLIPFQSS